MEEFYSDICNTLEDKYMNLLKEYSGYIKYLETYTEGGDNYGWQHTIKTWCKDCMQKYKIKPKLTRTKSKIDTNHKH